MNDPLTPTAQTGDAPATEERHTSAGERPSAEQNVEPSISPFVDAERLAETQHDATAEIATEWVQAESGEQVDSLIREGLSREVATLLVRRGVLSIEAANAYLNPSLEQLHDPLTLPGVGAAVDRLKLALKRDETVAVVGDYDADGISGTALLKACLSIAGLQCATILPHRLKDGYGFQLNQVERAELAGARLIVTVDCGMSSAEAVAAAGERGIDVVVTDHHLPTSGLPDALVLVNPRLTVDDPGPEGPSEAYPNPELCGAGIAFKLGVALLECLGHKVPIHSLLRVASIGTIADLVPLRGENRTIAALGLRALGSSRSPGLVALMEVSGVKRPVLAEDVGFRLGPRLNAAGRLDSPDRALELLLTKDLAAARRLAGELDHLNQERQTAERRVVREARAHFLSMPIMPRVLVAASENWHRGVVGIAAGRLAKEFNRPTILLGVDGAEATGSGRSIEPVHLHQFLLPWRDRLIRFGGHSQAVGMTVATQRLAQLIEEWNRSAQEWDEEILVKRFHHELEISDVKLLRDEFYAELEKFQPFGQNNPAPLIRVGPLKLARTARVFGKGHLDLLVEDPSGGRMRATAWNWENRTAVFESRFELLARLGWDDYTSSPAMTVVDAKAL